MLISQFAVLILKQKAAHREGEKKLFPPQIIYLQTLFFPQERMFRHSKNPNKPKSLMCELVRCGKGKNCEEGRQREAYTLQTWSGSL